MFREARLGDFEDVVRLYHQLNPGDPVLRDGSDAVVYQQILDSPGRHLFVVEFDGSVAATTYLNVIPNVSAGASSFAVIENVVVDRSRRRLGLGRQIVGATLRYAWESGCYKAMLMADSHDAVAHAFYRACGFSGDDRTAFFARPS